MPFMTSGISRKDAREIKKMLKELKKENKEIKKMLRDLSTRNRAEHGRIHRMVR